MYMYGEVQGRVKLKCKGNGLSFTGFECVIYSLVNRSGKVSCQITIVWTLRTYVLLLAFLLTVKQGR